METVVVVKFPIEGLHQWTGCDIDEVKFLRHPHRHVFFVTAKKQVAHNNRDVEIIMLKNTMQNYIMSKYKTENSPCCLFGEMSCEMIAQELVERFALVSCEVLEDNENGAEVRS